MTHDGQMSTALLTAVRNALSDLPSDAAAVETSDAPDGSCDVVVTPRNTSAAAMTLHHDGNDVLDVLDVTLGEVWFELHPLRAPGEVEEETRDLLAATVAGHLEVGGSSLRAFGRVHTSAGVVRVGHAHWPVPWRWRHTRYYKPYS